MGSGKRSAQAHSPRPSFAPAITLAANLAVAFLAAAILAASCAAASDSSRELVRLDAALTGAGAKALDRAFGRAYRSAASTADWLSILKRARAAGNERFLESAERAARSMPSSEPLAAALAMALLRAGRPLEAFGLFRERLSPEARPGLWAESFLALAGSGELGDAGVEPGDFARLSRLQANPAPLAGAAILALARGDRAEAAAYASAAREGGARLPAALLWDCGLLEELAAESEGGDPMGAEALDLAIMGDAAWAVGDPDLARLRWGSAISRDPLCSFKPYAKLAMTTADISRAESYRRRMKAAFLDGPRPLAEAAVAFAAPLVAHGRFAEAAAALETSAFDWEARALWLRARGAEWPDERLAAEAIRYAADAPAEAFGFALAILFELGRYDDLIVLFDSGEARGFSYPERWFYSAAASAARGDFASAASALEGIDAPEASLALGIAYRAMSKPERAASPLSAAALAFESPAAACAAFKELAWALQEAGDRDGAAGAFAAAASADPNDSEAAFLARGGPLR